MYQVVLTEKGKLELEKWDVRIENGNEDFTQEEDFQIITPLAIVAGRMSADFMTITTKSKSISEMISKLNEQMTYKCGYACDGSRLDPDWFTFKLMDDYRYYHQMKSTIGADLLYSYLFRDADFEKVKSELVRYYSKDNNDTIKEIITEKIENAETSHELFSIETNVKFMK